VISLEPGFGRGALALDEGFERREIARLIEAMVIATRALLQPGARLVQRLAGKFVDDAPAEGGRERQFGDGVAQPLTL
jgi:hypothetical protein